MAMFSILCSCQEDNTIDDMGQQSREQFLSEDMIEKTNPLDDSVDEFESDDFRILSADLGNYNQTSVNYVQSHSEDEQQEIADLYTRIYDNEIQNHIVLPPKDSNASEIIHTKDITPKSNSKIAHVVSDDKLVLYVEYDLYEESYISLYDDSGQLLYTYYPKSPRTVHDVILTDKYIYFVESSADINTVAQEWALFKVNISTFDIEIIARAEDYSQSILPRINRSGDDLVFISQDSGHNNNDMLLYLYDEDGNEVRKILKLNYLSNPYLIPYINDEKIYMPEYDSNGWYIMVLDMNSNKITKVYPRFDYNSEFLTNVGGNEDYIAFTTSFDVLYLLNFNTGDVRIIDVNVFSFALRGNYLIYTSDSSIYVYDIDKNLSYVIHDANSNGIVYGFFSSSNECIAMNGYGEDQTSHPISLVINE
jgi:hypothetical protein